MKKAKLFVTLLLSALMVFGVFGLTSFAADESSAATGHTWRAWDSSAASGSVAFNCNGSDKCEYKDPNNIVVGIDVSDDIYNGEEFDLYANWNLKFTQGKDWPEEDDFYFGDPEYKVAGAADSTYSKKAPSAAGSYTVRQELMINGEGKGVYSFDNFNIVNPTVTVNPEYVYGQRISPTPAAGDIKLTTADYTLKYKSLDVKGAKFTKIAPIAVGHYRVRATFNNGGIAEADFAIVKNTSAKLTALAFSVDSAKVVSDLKDYDLTGKTVKQIVSGLVNIGIEGATPVGNEGNSEYGKPIVIIPLYENGVFPDVVHYGVPVFKYREVKGETGSETYGEYKKFVSGATILKKGKYEISFSFPATRNHVASSGTLTVNVTEADVKLVSEPEAKKHLVFNDVFQKLVTPGKAVGATFTYAAVEKVADGDTPEPEEKKFAAEIPTARAAGEYVVFWRLTADDNHKTEAKGSVTVSIAAVEPEDDPDSAELPNVKNMKVKAGKRSFKVSWTKLSAENRAKIDMIEVQYTTDPDFKTGIKTKSISKAKSSYKVTGLKKHTKYYVRVRTVEYNVENEDGEVIPKAASTGTAVKDVKTK